MINTSTKQIELEILKEKYHMCYYNCGGTSQYITFHNLKNIDIDTFQKLFERKINENLTGYDFETVNSCCIPYNIRIALNNNILSIKHLKKLKKFQQQIELYEQQNFKIDLVQEQKKQENQKYQYHLLENQFHQQETQSKLIQKNKFQKEQKLQNDQINAKFQTTLKLYLEKCMEELRSIINVELSSQIESENLQLIQCSQKKLYYSNFNKLIFISNQEKLSCLNINQQKLNQQLEQIFLKNVSDNLRITLNKSENLTIFELPETEIQELKINEKQILENINKQNLKQNQPKNYKNQDVKVDKNIFKEFTFEQFYVGDIKVVIKDPEYNAQIIKFINDYNIKVHNYKINDHDIYHLFCKNQFQDQYLENEEKNLRIQLGLRQVIFLLNDQLMALGIIKLTKNYLISDYFTYDTNLNIKSFGIFSMIVEIEYAKQIKQHFPDFQYYSPCYTVINQPKMSYKLQFSGTQIQCPKTYIWIDYDKQLKRKLQQQPLVLYDNEIIQQNDFSKINIQIENMIFSSEQLIERDESNNFFNLLNTYFQILGQELMVGLIFYLKPQFAFKLDQQFFLSIIDLLEKIKPDNEFKSYYLSLIYE